MTVSACDPPTLESLDLPAPSIGSDAYAVTAKFANALNLPDMAKVRLKGADIGEVESIEAIDDVAVVKLRILRGVRLPVGSTAQLRSATPLGDVFVALEPPIQPSAELLKDGDVLDLQTTSAVLVNGGVVRNLTHLVNGLGKASADNGQTLGDIVGQSNQLLDTLNKRSAQIQNSLDKTSELAASISSREKTINELIAASGPGVQAIDANQIGDLANKSGQISDQLAKFPSIQGTDGRSTLADLNSISRGFNDIAVSPDTSLVALNRLIPMLIKANAGSAQAHDVNIAKLALGNIDDAGYKGSSDYHGPKQADWAYFVGSFKYTLYRLQERIVGQGPNPPAPPG
jgi:virulence factor Mce-like protein